MKKEVTLGQVLGMMLTLLGIIIGWAFTTVTRLTTAENINQSQNERMQVIETKMERQNDKIDNNYIQIRDRLDDIYKEIKKR